MKQGVKGFIIGVIITSLIMMSMPVLADSLEKDVKAIYNAVSILINGKKVQMENITINNQIYVPAKDLSEKLGSTFEWNKKTNIVSINDKKTAKPVVLKADKTKPYVLKIEAKTGGTTIEVTFNEKLNAATAKNISNYVIHERYGAKTALTVLSAKLDAAGTKVILTTSGQKEATLYMANISNVKDLAGNIMDSYSNTFIGMRSTASPNPPEVSDKTKPSVIKVEAKTGGTTVEVTFDKIMDKAAAENVANYVIKERYGAKTALNVLAAKLDAAGTKVTLSTSGQKAATLYDISISNVKDLAGNIMNSYSNTFIGMSSSASSDSPEILTIKSATFTSNTTIEVVFSNKLDKASAESTGHYQLNKKYGTRDEVQIKSAVLDSTLEKVTLTLAPVERGVLYNFDCSGINDIYGNTLNSYNTSLVNM
ncbi:MAG: hypothetical protein K0R84_1856 [Clostridia bacterium]|jgi:uncharacterized protein YqgV (UPF0045/DUF77 family)|nr:hypothetical protein [Clostridia bacterium]